MSPRLAWHQVLRCNYDTGPLLGSGLAGRGNRKCRGLRSGEAWPASRPGSPRISSRERRKSHSPTNRSVFDLFCILNLISCFHSLCILNLISCFRSLCILNLISCFRSLCILNLISCFRSLCILNLMSCFRSLCILNLMSYFWYLFCPVNLLYLVFFIPLVS
jgi:hypothetical protein